MLTIKQLHEFTGASVRDRPKRRQRGLRSPKLRIGRETFNLAAAASANIACARFASRESHQNHIAAQHVRVAAVVFESNIDTLPGRKQRTSSIISPHHAM